MTGDSMIEWKPRSKFIRGKCPECGSEVIIFSHASTKVYCDECGALLAIPTGGKAKLKIITSEKRPRKR